MSIRVDTSPLIAGALVVGNPGLGVLAEQVPSSGTHGAGFLYPSLQFPLDTGKEVRGFITRWPALGTLVAYEDSSFEYTGPDDSFEFQMYVDGLPVGTPQTVTLVIGVPDVNPDGSVVRYWHLGAWVEGRLKIFRSGAWEGATLRGFVGGMWVDV